MIEASRGPTQSLLSCDCAPQPDNTELLSDEDTAFPFIQRSLTAQQLPFGRRSISPSRPHDGLLLARLLPNSRTRTRGRVAGPDACRRHCIHEAGARQSRGLLGRDRNAESGVA
eukprot:1592299-Rhodomonas_salina.2